MRLDRFAQPADERLEINVRTFLARRRLGGFGRFLGIFLWIGRRAGGEGKSGEQDEALENSRFHRGEVDR